MVVFIVVGRMGKSLTVSKVDPFLAAEGISKAYVFRQEPGFPVQGAEYIVLPRWLIALKPAALGKVLRIIYEPLQLLWFSRKIKPTLINGVFTLPKGLNSTLVGKIMKTPSIVSVIGGVIEITTRMPLSAFWQRVNIWMLKTCSAVTTKGQVVSRFLESRGVPRKKIFTLNGSIDTDRFSFDPAIPKDIDILFVGDFRPLKGPDRVLQVVRFLKKDIPGLKAALVGTGVLFDGIKTQIKEFGLQNDVLLPGYVEHPERWFQRSRCILIPSESEGLPTCMLEAMSCGCVPVVSDVGNVIEAAIHEKNAMIIKDYTDIASFYRYAKKILTDEVLHNQMARRAVQTVQNTYSIEKQAQIVNRIIRYLEKGVRSRP